MKRAFTKTDWALAIGVSAGVILVPGLLSNLGRVLADPTVTPVAVHVTPHPVPALLDIFLSPSISLGNVLTILGTLWWVGRWGARTIALMDSIPSKLDRFDERLESIEKQGCYRLDEHRAVIRAIRKNHPDVKFDDTEDL